MQRYFVAPEQFDGTSKVRLTGEDAFHAVRVMRMKPGDPFIVSDGSRVTAIASITEADSSEVKADIVELLASDSEPAWAVTIAQSLPKGDKMELVIQKGTEIGAYAFAPFQSERMIVQYDHKKEAKRLERWSKIAKEAAEQSHRNRVPAVEAVKTWRELMAAVPDFDLALFCYEREGDAAAGTGIADAVRKWRSEQAPAQDAQPHIILMVGPEGGFTEAEANEAEAAGAVIVGLGKRILRTETAGIVGLTCLLYESGEMGGA
ncbi:16S rRNA (uracil(1498)-N(3))-methyltransferase [Paenibacillus protaetiae]|uniref:Ribosomal RNA small subunit methyltransferase E n=1 Tax=Paenibacillus protaetiae TaxID=2509456 RepID=A0A4P6F7B7_9BACL|nr:16S rRNA (uracil(1498)-N(3))-methyltransferase [Paenibacillus protaetiae]QAY66318.1 16S rRNA (uracil(1498)-N(3))-methyltransferase [Paenibacillus protaetiae]